MSSPLSAVPTTRARSPRNQGRPDWLASPKVFRTEVLAGLVVALALIPEAMVVFAKRVARLAHVSAVIDPDGKQVVYAVTGELFFASSNDLVSRFAYKDDPDDIVIDLTGAHIWDASSVAALDAIEAKYGRLGKKVTVVGLNAPSAEMRARLAGRLGAGH
ncbi:MFS superfamily sulfate permease-like transporter [Streptomyces sp. V4I23]|uniref:STAS domain-containing protein n=1 Tax=Streptomyces sp. V4I23 TaxID=3042282 RepID=UPI00277D3B38|nr:MFS superfamily sulfate permease-like transporter [Streptomyces sp. V4I23]